MAQIILVSTPVPKKLNLGLELGLGLGLKLGLDNKPGFCNRGFIQNHEKNEFSWFLRNPLLKYSKVREVFKKKSVTFVTPEVGGSERENFSLKKKKNLAKMCFRPFRVI